MPKLYFGEALKLMFKSLPCVLANFGAHLAFGLCAAIYYGIVLALYGLLAESLPLVALIILLGGLGTSGWLYHLAKHYILYVIKSGHIAVMAELIDKGQLPQGVSQLEWGKQKVKERFLEVSAMSAVDVLLRGVVRSITDMMEGAINYIPLPGIEKLSRMVSLIIRQASDYIDEAILARIFLKKDSDIFQEAKNGTILYAMSWKPILTNAAGLALFSWASFVIFLLLWSPVGILAYKFAPNMAFWSSLCVIALAYVSKASLGDTFALATTIVAFQKETKDMQPNVEWERKLHSSSEKFRELSKKAADAVKSKVSPTPPMPAQTSSMPQEAVLPPPIPESAPIAPPPVPS